MAKVTPLCNKCSAMCCRYVALPIETPKDREDFDDIRWYLSHEGVSVFVEKGEWYVNFSGSCRHIDKNYRCSIYSHRPKICRKYGTRSCDRTSEEYDYELHFTDDSQMLEYMKVKFDNMKINPNLPKKKKAAPKKAVSKASKSK